MNLIKKFKYAFNGLAETFKGSSFKIQLVSKLCVIVAGIIFSISAIEWLILIIIISLVLSAEIFNTAIEKLCDLFTSGWLLHEIKVIKDISAGAVAILSLAAIIIGLIIFIPYML
jgi:diacylglycerol kinase